VRVDGPSFGAPTSRVEAADLELKTNEQSQCVEKGIRGGGARATGLQPRPIDSGFEETVDGAVGTSATGQWSITNIDLLQNKISAGRSEIKQRKARMRGVRWHGWISNWWGRALDGTKEKLSLMEQQRTRWS